MNHFFKYIIILILFFGTNYLKAQVEIPANELKIGNFTEDDYIYAPAISFDGEFLIFTVIKENSYKFYECKKNTNGWSDPVELIDITNNLGENTYKNSPVYNYDASIIYFEAQNGSNTDIFYSKRTSTGWEAPVSMPYKINSNKNEGEPSISPNDNIFYFVRFEDEKNSECGKIYVSKKDINLNWTKAEPLLEPLNLECERTPRVLSDNKTLIFASKREGNKEFVLYYSKNVFSNIWFLPKQIGVFSKNDNLHCCVDQNAQKIILSSSKENKKSSLMIADYPQEYKPNKSFVLTGKFTDENGNPIEGTISLLDPISTVTNGKYFNNPQTGEYKIYLPTKSKYVLDFYGENFSHQYKNFDITKSKELSAQIDVNLFSTTKLSLNVFDKDIFEPYDVEIEVFDESKNTKIDTKVEKTAFGKYSIDLPIGKKYKLELNSEFSNKQYTYIDLTGAVVYQKFEKNIEIESYKAQYTFQVIDAQNGDAIDCEIILRNQSTSKTITTKAKTDENGEVAIYVRKGDIYDVTINPQGYAFYNTSLEITDNQDKEQKVELQPLKQDVKIKLNNITFETNSAELNLESYKELNNVVLLMNENPEIKVEISAHTDDVGSEDYNQKLSEKRAQSVVDYLILHDVDKTKLISQGYGESQPLVANNTEENKAKNRRVELKIIEVNE